jgi:phospholipid/cholesterol/gamma-HCH transport system ATP-binding protein
MTDKNHDVLVEIKDLHFSRGEVKIFNGVNITIRRHAITAIMGPSGTGKTTLIKLISGQLTPDSGLILFEGENVHSLSHRRLFELRKKMGMLFQSGALLTDLSVFENVALPLREHTRLPEKMIRDIVLFKLQAVGLRGARNLMPSELSGGMARRVALARAIVLDPMIISYDEPFTGQDPISKGVLVQLIRLLNDALNMTSILVSHDVKETLSIADDIYVISRGEVVQSGSSDELKKSRSAWVQQFMSGLPDGPVPFHYPGRELAEELLE